MTAVVALLSLCVMVLGVLVVGLLRSHAEVLRTLHDMGGIVGQHEADSADPVRGLTVDAIPDGRAQAAPQPGARVPADVTGVTPSGDSARVALSGTRHTTLLTFLTTGCASCAAVWRDIAAEPPGDADQQIVIVTRGADMESPAAVANLAPAGVTVIQSTEAWEAFGISGAPFFVLVDGRRGVIVGEGSAARWSQVRELLGRAAADGAHAGPRRSRREVLTGRRREEMADRQLREAGILPGAPSLYRSGEEEGP